jgi:hypothetical protein
MFFLQNILPLQQQRSVMFRVDSLALWKTFNKEDAVSIPKTWGQNLYTLGILGPGSTALAANPLSVALSQGNSDITRIRPWSAVMTGSHLDHVIQKYSKSCSDDWHR